MGKVMRHTLRSEERFSRNAETDLVCRLLLEKTKKQRSELISGCALYLILRSSDHQYLHAFPTRRSSDLARPRRNGERRRAPTASISKESPAITGVVEMVIRRPI